MPIADILKRSRQGNGWTAGSPAQVDSSGLQVPPEVMALISSLMMPPVVQGVGQIAAQAPQRLAGEAGAIFPEGGALPMGNPTAMKELGQILPESQRLYSTNLANALKHGENYDWPAVMRDKWSMLVHAGGS